MAKPKISEIKVTQDAPTQEQPRDEDGFILDEFGLPIVGPRRAQVLAERGIPDPAEAAETAEVAQETAPETLAEALNLENDHG